MNWETISVLVVIYAIGASTAFLIYLPLEKTKLNMIKTIIKSVLWFPYEVGIAFRNFIKKIQKLALDWENLPDK